MSYLMRTLLFVVTLGASISPLSADPPTIGPHKMSPEALAKHLGIMHSSFKLSFDEQPKTLSFAIEVYEHGKRTLQRKQVRSHSTSKKQPCTVMFSRRDSDGRLLITIVTPAMTYSDVIDFPYDPPMVFPGPSMDAKGRIVLAAKLPNKNRGVATATAISVDKAVKALVIHVREK